ncbi:MAG: GNAT family N-acetyltransferase [Bosea sp. (in: a-proteobacteria)]|jgi:L-amino acid N-acyltransferase
MIRPATAQDVPAIRAIYNHVVATSTAVFNEHPVSLEDRLAWFSARQDAGYPVLVADIAGEVAGYASYGAFRAGTGYRFAAEHSVHIRPDSQGRGLGTELVSALFPLAQAQGLHVLVAGIDAGNRGSIRLHERLGFVQTGLMREVGRKFDRWLDLALMQRFL